MATGARGVTPVISVVLMVAVAVVLAGVLSAFVLVLTPSATDTAPNAKLDIEFGQLDDGVGKNDSISITHVAGNELERERLEVVVGDDVVYNETADSETTGDTFEVPGLVVEVNAGDGFNDLNKPCRVDGTLVSPKDTCGWPPGDSDGSDSGVVLQWAGTVGAGATIVIQERNASKAVDVIQPGETV